MHDRLFEAALGITPPWFVAGVSFDEPVQGADGGHRLQGRRPLCRAWCGRRAPGARHRDQDLL